MINFFIILIAFITTAIASFFCFGRKDYKFLSARAERWPKHIQEKVTKGGHYFFKVFALILLFYIIIPMILDIPSIMQGDLQTITGKPTSVTNNFGRWYLYQNIKLENQRYVLCFSNIPVKEDKEYNIKYLPHSKFIIEIHEVSK